MGARSLTVSISPGGETTGVDVDLVRGPVANLAVTGVSISSAPDTIIEGKTAPLAAAITTSSAVQPVVFWASLDTTVLTISDSVATGVSVGTALVVASAGLFADTVPIEVIVPPVATVQISPDSANLLIGTTRSYSALLFDADAAPLTGRAVVWASADPSVATVGASTGIVTAVAIGSTTIAATSEGVADSAIVVVVPVPVASVVVSPDTSVVDLGDTSAFTAQTFDSIGGVLTGRAIAWSTADPAVATVDGSGVVTGVGVGTTTVTATSEGASGNAVVQVVLTDPANLNRWVDGVGGNWSDATGWSKGAVPTATDSVLVDVAGTYTLVVDVPVTVAYLGVGGATGLQTISLPSSALDVTGMASIGPNGELRIAGGTLTGGGTVSVAGVLDWTAGTMSGSGTTRVEAGGSASVDGVVTLDARTIENHGVFAYSGGTPTVLTGDNAPLFDNRAGATIDFRSVGTPFGTGVGGVPTLLNAGTMQKSVGTGITIVEWPATSTGAIDLLTGGDVAFDGGGSFAGTISAAAAGRMLLRTGSFTFENGLVTSGAGTVDVTTGTATVPAGATAALEGLRVTNAAGVFAANGTASVVGTLVWNGGTIGGSGVVRIETGATVTATGILTLDEVTVENNGTFVFSGGGSSSMTGNNGPVFDNRAGATIDFASVGTPFGVGTGTLPSLINAGTLQKSVGTGNTIVEWPITSTGSVDLLTQGDISSEARSCQVSARAPEGWDV